MRASWVFRVLVDTHIWVGLGAAVQVWLTCAALGRVGDAQSAYAVTAGLAATGYYTSYRNLGAKLAGRAKLGWRSLGGLILLALATVLLVKLPVEYLDAAALPVVSVILYALGRYLSANALAFGFAKPLVLAAVWTSVVSYMPLFAAHAMDYGQVASRFCFFLAIGIVSDYKDAVSDERSGLWTLGQALPGRSGTALCGTLLVASVLFLLPGVLREKNIALVALQVASGIGIPVLWYAFRQNPKRGYYDFLVDGLLVLAGVVYCLLQVVLW